jgi:mRNA interferase MazF
MQRAATKLRPAIPTEKKHSLELRRSTRVGEVYWCSFSPHNWVPEFDDQHLVVIIRGGKKDHGAHIVVPLTKRSQGDSPHGYRLGRNPNPGSAPEAWAVCDHVYTVASERLKLLRDSKGVTKDPERIDSEDLTEISRRVFNALRTFFDNAYRSP